MFTFFLLLIEFNDMIAGMEVNKKLNPFITESFLKGKNSTFHLFFVSQSYFKVPVTIIPNATNYFIMKVPKKIELQQIASNYSSDNEFKYFVKPYKDNTKEPYSFLVNDTTLSSDNPL